VGAKNPPVSRPPLPSFTDQIVAGKAALKSIPTSPSKPNQAQSAGGLEALPNALKVLRKGIVGGGKDNEERLNEIGEDLENLSGVDEPQMELLKEEFARLDGKERVDDGLDKKDEEDLQVLAGRIKNLKKQWGGAAPMSPQGSEGKPSSSTAKQPVQPPPAEPPATPPTESLPIIGVPKAPPVPPSIPPAKPPAGPARSPAAAAPPSPQGFLQGIQNFDTKRLKHVDTAAARGSASPKEVGPGPNVQQQALQMIKQGVKLKNMEEASKEREKAAEERGRLNPAAATKPAAVTLVQSLQEVAQKMKGSIPNNDNDEDNDEDWGRL
jgi:hypothetical protein